MFRLTDVVKNLLIINVIVFIAIIALDNSGKLNVYDYFVLHGTGTGNFKPIQLITSMFSHQWVDGGGQLYISHILMNMLSLFFLGPTVELALGKKRFLALYISAGLIASAAQMVVLPQGASLGASGAVMGVAVAFATMFPNMKLMLIFPPIPIKAKYLITLFVLGDMFFGITSINTGIGHYAHLGGAAVGFIMVHLWGKANLR